MRYKKLIILLFALLWLMPAQAGNAPKRSAELSVGTGVHRPEWVDMGMCDVLAVTSTSTLTPPTTVRLVHDTPTGFAPSVALRHMPIGSRMLLRADMHPYVHRSCIYLLRCLRL